MKSEDLQVLDRLFRHHEQSDRYYIVHSSSRLHWASKRQNTDARIAKINGPTISYEFFDFLVENKYIRLVKDQPPGYGAYELTEKALMDLYSQVKIAVTLGFMTKPNWWQNFKSKKRRKSSP